MDLAVNPLDAQDLIVTFGVLGIFVIVFAETGLLLGFFLPGDTLLFLAGFFASTDPGSSVHLPLAPLLIGTPIAAIAGAQVGYLIGRRAGPVLFERGNSRLFSKTYVEKSELVLNRFGPGKAVVLARFIPIVRTFLNPLAGVLRMDARRFLVANIAGGIVWTVGVILAGYALGKALGDRAQDLHVDRYVLPIVIGVLVISAIPTIRELRKNRGEATKPTR